MLTKNEINVLNLSPTKKDFVQIWNELLEVAGKLSERWDPTSTNESDPGIVILKALTGIADKLNYNIDKNILEAFMPTAAQEDSMRKLCDMLGYNVKYYRSAETDVTIKYYNSDPSAEEETAINSGLLIPKFTVITNSDKDISYFTTNQTAYYISAITPSVTLPCMEGQIVKCESINDNNVITISQISDNNRFYLPEAQIAENGIFVYNVFSSDGTSLTDGTPWEKVDNLNIQSRGSRVFKFGYDSYESRPYLEFPADYSELINDGLFIYYARTSGANGNVSTKTLTQLEIPSDWEGVSAESFSVENIFAATTGANIETIRQAYTNFKKTIGTFETLVTCRDYMNKIYTLTNDVGKPLVSNILVTDIRNDLNRAVTICSCADAGIFYKETPLTTTTYKKFKEKATSTEVEVEYEEPAINHFDLVLYPFKSYNQIKNNVKDIQTAYESSFKYDEQTFYTVKSELDNKQAKTIAHNIVSPREQDILSINNYLRLSAIIGTNSKITTEEATLLKETIKIALANAFNMRELDFGEEIPFESIVEVIEKSDPRIKVVSLNEPALYTTFSVYEGSDHSYKEYAVASDWLTEEAADASGRFEIKKDSEGNYIGGTFNTKEAKKIYNKLAVRNVLAGRIPLFKYNTTFNTSFSEGAYRVTKNTLNPPAGITEPSADEPYTIYTENEKIYTGQYIALAVKPEYLSSEPTAENPDITSVDAEEAVTYTGKWSTDEDEAGKPVYAKIIYTESAVPDTYTDNVITKDTDDNNITEVETSCKIYSDKYLSSNHISDVTLSTGEYIKFRAPNFITTKTYPAYVNYHLALNKELLEKPEPAEAYSLFSLINGSGAATDAKWQDVFNYFNERGLTKTFRLTQKITPATDNSSSINKGELVITLGNTSAVETEKPEAILRKSGCVALADSEATLKWEATNNNVNNLSDTIKTIKLDLESVFITNSTDFNRIKDSVDGQLNNIKLSEDCLKNAWTISFEFKYIPFDTSTLAVWETFILEKCYELFGFTPAVDTNILLWRAYGEGYAAGKHILSSGIKLMPFTSTYFGLLDNNNLPSRLHGIYVAQYLGRDQKANFISNNEEYKLRAGEYLFIEYTPSTTTEEEGTTQAQEAKKEVHGPGTIIRPNGFEEGLINSASIERSATKNVTFKLPDGSSAEKALYSLGATEQIEIREYSQVVLNKELFANSAVIYVYKNFNNCPELEGPAEFDGGKRINSSYTLKDGEYIFYTDQNKTELAYFTSGTEVTLTGKLVLPKFTTIDLATIFESGLQDIPWYPISLTGKVSATIQEPDGIIFQEYQYITLGPDDTLKDLTLLGTNAYLDSQWQYCDNPSYVIAGADEVNKLPKINTTGSSATGCGWEASSILELNASPSVAQTLRNTDKVQTSITLSKTSAGSVGETITVEAKDAEHPLSFKTNLACQSSTGKAKITELFSNTNNLKSFEFKVFSEEAPSVTRTVKNSLAPHLLAGTESSTAITLASYGDIWNSVYLSTLAPGITDNVSYDRALKLPVSILPNTYGIFSIYLDSADGSDTWIELLPGASTADVTLYNVPKAEADTAWVAKDQDGNNINPRLVLEQGLNCIRVNTTCDIYIKASKTANGTLYFDDLRLVDTTPITYIDENGKMKSMITQGLNTNQIGYLYVDEESKGDGTFNVFDKRARQKLRSEYRDTALTELSSKEQELSDKFKTSWKEILENKYKAQKIKDFIDAVISEIDAVSNNDGLETLFKNFKDAYTDLMQELNLKEALDNNKDLKDLEQELVVLLGTSVGTEAAKQELLTKLEELRQNVLNNMESFDSWSKEDVLADFTACESINDSIIEDLKQASLELVNSDYDAKLSAISESVSNVTDSESVSDLTTALEKLYANKHTELLNNVQALLAENRDDLLSAVADVYSAASGKLIDDNYVVDYSEVAAKLITLREYVSSSAISNFVSKIEHTANESLYSELAGTVTALKGYLDSSDSLITSINSVLGSAQSKADDTGKDSEFLNAIANIQASIQTDRSAQISKILDDMESTLSSIKDAYTDVLKNLKDTQDSKISELAVQLETITKARETDLLSIDMFKPTDIKTDYNKLPYGEKALLSIWPEYAKLAFTTGIDNIYATIYGVVNGGATTSIINSFVNRPVLNKAVNFESFDELCKQANTFAKEDTRDDARLTLINSLSGAISSSELENAMAGISKENTRNTVITNIITSLSKASSTTEKYELNKRLVEELEKEIQLDTALVNISAKLLCPSILVFESESKWAELQNDTFYSALRDYIVGSDGESGIKADLLAKETANDFSTLLTDSIKNYLATANTKIETLLAVLDVSKETDFKTWLTKLTENTLKDSLLNSSYINNIFDLQDFNNSLVELTTVKECNLFKYLSDDIIVAWEVVLEDSADTTSKWLDSSGKDFKQYADGSWVDANGYWQYADGRKVKVNVKHQASGTWLDGGTGLEIQINDGSTWYISNIDEHDSSTVTLSDTSINDILLDLLGKASKISSAVISESFASSVKAAELELQLLEEIRKIDKDRLFYYNVPIESNVAIDFTESDEKLNTLMNPNVNYDINNINNSFVISKLDINYLTNGIQIARSSRLS